MFSYSCSWIFLIACFAKDVVSLSDIQKTMIHSKLMSSGIGCLKDHPLSLSDINMFRKKIIPDGTNAKCFAECLFKKIGIMDEMGKLSASGAQRSAMQIFKNSNEHLNNVDQIVEKCSSVNQHDENETGMKECNRAKLAFTCLAENAPKFGFDLDL